MVCKLTDGTKEKIVRTEAVRSIYSKEFATRGMSFDFAKATWLQYLDKRTDYFSFS